MDVSTSAVQRFSCGTEHIFWEHNEVLKGTFIIHAYSHRRVVGVRLWLAFLEEHPEPIYFGTDDPSYIGNHCKFHGNFGGKKVYKYVR